jgi:hypothetical protein
MGDIRRGMLVPIVLIAGDPSYLRLHPESRSDRLHGGDHARIGGLEGAKGEEASEAGVDSGILAVRALRIMYDHPQEAAGLRAEQMRFHPRFDPARRLPVPLSQFHLPKCRRKIGSRYEPSIDRGAGEAENASPFLPQVIGREG